MERYRERGLRVFESIEQHCTTPTGGYAALRNVASNGAQDKAKGQEDLLESFFFAETLKYLYLLFHDDGGGVTDGSSSSSSSSSSSRSRIDLERYVFTTEAHLVHATPPEDGQPAKEADGEDDVDDSSPPAATIFPPWWHGGGILDEPHDDETLAQEV